MNTQRLQGEGNLNSPGKVAHQPVVLVAPDSKVGVVGQVDHVGWPHID